MARQELQIKTADGAAKAGLFIPAGKPKAGIILFMDIHGPRPALDQMGERLAASGYATLVPDLFYRFGDYEKFDPKTAMMEETTRKILYSRLGGTSQEMTQRDAGAFLDALTTHGVSGKAGIVGYCMGGARSLNAAAAHHDRVAAAASFHGGNLASDAPDSPHRSAALLKTVRIHVGAAGVDGSFPPQQAGVLAQALREAEVDYVIENYVGVEHGWCVPDSRVHNPAGAERHWKRLITFFDEVFD